MNRKQLQVIKWWNSGRDYEAGIALFSAFSKNKILIHTLSKKSAKFGRLKLEYELPKAVGLDYKNIPVMQHPENSTKDAQDKKEIPLLNQKKPTLKKQIQDSQNTAQPAINHSYPKIIRRLKYLDSELYNKRSIAHKGLTGIPQDNSEPNMDARAKLLSEIKDLSGQMDVIWKHIKKWEETGQVPDEQEVFPGNQENPLPDDPVQLKKIKKNIQSAITKDCNKLNYQTTKKQKTQNRMPPGPKRQKIEQRIKRRESEIQRIEQKLADIENVD